MSKDTLFENLLIISVKPEFAKKIINGEKTIELRKSSPQKVGKENYVIIYVTSPIKKIWGICKISDIIKDDPRCFWNKYGNQTGVTKKQFEDYYKYSKTAFGIVLKEIKNFSKYSIELENLKKAFPNFKPPQTYSYIHRDEINFSILRQIFNKIN